MKGKWHIETSQAMPDPFVRKWSGRLDSNQRPLEPHSSALSQAALRPENKDLCGV